MKIEKSFEEDKNFLITLLSYTATNPNAHSLEVRTQAHSVAEMLEKIENTLATLRKYVKREVSFDSEVNYIT